jgi:uncharacterized protein YjbJ (UPF0337 family)
MSKEGIEGATQKAVGAVKETLGKTTGSTKLQAEGVADKVAGSTKAFMERCIRLKAGAAFLL